MLYGFQIMRLYTAVIVKRTFRICGSRAGETYRAITGAMGQDHTVLVVSILKPDKDKP